MSKLSDSSDNHLDSSISSSDSSILLKINIPEQNLYKTIKVPKTFTVHQIKNQVINSLNISLKSPSQNYGLVSSLKTLFLPDHKIIADILPPRAVNNLTFKLKHRINIPDNSKRRISVDISKPNTKENELKFMELIELGQYDTMLNSFLKKNFDPNFIAPSKSKFDGHTPLTLAAMLDSTYTGQTHELIVLLLFNGAILDYKNKRGHTALHTAVQYHNSVAVNIFLNWDPDLFRALDSTERPPLFYLSRPAYDSDPDSGTETLPAPTPPNKYGYFTLTKTKRKEINFHSLRLNAAKRTLETASQIVESLFRFSKYSPEFFHFQDQRGWSIWHHLAYHNNNELLLKILDHADLAGFPSDSEHLKINVISNLTGNTAVHIAALHNSTNVIETLIKICKADANVRNFSGLKAIDYCSVGVVGMSPIGRILDGVTDDEFVEPMFDIGIYEVREAYDARSKEELTLFPGDEVKVVATPKGDYWEGFVGRHRGWFPKRNVKPKR